MSMDYRALAREILAEQARIASEFFREQNKQKEAEKRWKQKREWVARKVSRSDVVELIEKTGTSTGLNLRGANLDGCDLRGLSLRGADFRSAGFKEANLEGTDLAHARFDGISWTTSCTCPSVYKSITDTKYLASPKLKGVRRGSSHFSMEATAPLWTRSGEPVSLTFGETVSFDGASLVAANLRGANLEGACLTGSCLQEANLEGASFIDADLRLACLDEANLKAVNLTKTRLSGASFSGSKTNLESVNMSGVNLSSDRTGILHLGNGEIEVGPAELNFSNLTRANLKGACLLGVSLQWANLEGAKLDGAEIGREMECGLLSWSRTSFYHARGLTWQQLRSAKLNSPDVNIAWDTCRYNETGRGVKDFGNFVDGYMRSADYESALFWLNMFYSSFMSHRINSIQDREIVDAMAATFSYKADIFKRLNRPAEASKLEEEKVLFWERVEKDRKWYEANPSFIYPMR